MRQRVGAVVIALGLLLQGCATLRGRVDTSAGQVRAYEGRVVALRVGASEPEALDLDSKLFVGDVVRTQEKSRCRIALRDGTLITLGERSELEIRESAAAAAAGPQSIRRLVLKVATGLLKLVSFAFPGAGIAVEVLTALASFTFSGTEGIVEVTPTQVSALNLAGTVRAVSLQEGIPGGVVLLPGEGTNIELGKAPSLPSRWPAARVEKVTEATYLP